MSKHRWSRLPLATKRTCKVCQIVWREGEFFGVAMPDQWLWPTIPVYLDEEPPCLGFDVHGSEPKAEVLRTFLRDGTSLERALELTDLVLTREGSA